MWTHSSFPSLCQTSVLFQVGEKPCRHKMVALKHNGTWHPVSLPPWKKATGCRWVYTAKLIQMGPWLTWRHAELLRDTHRYMVFDYHNTFSHAMMLHSVEFLFLWLQLISGLYISWTLRTPYWYSWWEGLYGANAQFCCKGRVWKVWVKKYLYGLKQSQGMIWKVCNCSSRIWSLACSKG